MRINHKILNIPPYISTSWRHVVSLEMEGERLIVRLQNGSSISVPDLSLSIINAIFATHAGFLESEAASQTVAKSVSQKQEKDSTDMITAHLTQVNNNPLLRHNPEEKDYPILPSDLLQKIAKTARTMGLQDPSVFPEGEPHCNCPHCQVAKALQKSFEDRSASNSFDEEEITDKDLSFRSWILRPKGEKTYIVVHPDDREKEYEVFLGSPIRCSCGSDRCEHMLAVLSG